MDGQLHESQAGRRLMVCCFLVWSVHAACLSSPTKLIPGDPGPNDAADVGPDIPSPPDLTSELDVSPDPGADPGMDPGEPDPDHIELVEPKDVVIPDPAGPDEAMAFDNGPPDEGSPPDLPPDPGFDPGPPPANLAWDKSSVQFIETWVYADSEPIELTLKNTGGTKSGKITVTIDNLDDYVLADDDCSDSVLFPGSTCAVKVGFHPMKKGQRTGTIQALADPGGMVVVDLSGISKSVMELKKDVLGWPEDAVQVGQTVDGQFYLVNVSEEWTGTLNYQIIPPGAPFEPYPNTCVEKLDPTGSCHPHVRFSPTAAGTFEAVFRVSADPGGGDEVKFSFTAVP